MSKEAIPQNKVEGEIQEGYKLRKSPMGFWSQYETHPDGTKMLTHTAFKEPSKIRKDKK